MANGSHHYLGWKAFPTLTHGQAPPAYRIVEDNYKAIEGTIMGLCGTITVIVGGCDVVPRHMRQREFHTGHN